MSCSTTGVTTKPTCAITSVRRSVSFSPDGQILASGSLDSTIKLWYVPPILCKYGDRASLSEAEMDQLLQDLEQWQAETKRRVQERKEKIRRMEEERRREEEERRRKEEEERRRREEERRRMEEQRRLEEEKRRMEEERKRMEEERRRMEELRAQRRAQGLCEDCGQPLSFWDKLLGRTKCPNCR